MSFGVASSRYKRRKFHRKWSSLFQHNYFISFLIVDLSGYKRLIKTCDEELRTAVPRSHRHSSPTVSMKLDSLNVILF